MQLIERVIRRLGRSRIRTEAQQILAPMGLLPIGETTKDDVFIVGYPKSGHTWLQTIVAALVFGIDVERCPDDLVQDLVPDIYVRPFYRRFLPAAYFKSHELPCPRYRRVVNVVRDGRDVMVSWWHFRRAVGNPGDLKQIIESPNHSFSARWQEHIEQWMKNPYDAEILTIRYEDLRKDPIPQLVSLVEFLGINVKHNSLEMVAHQCSFEQMKQRERRFGWDDKKWPKDKPFVRRGTVGGYRDEMTKEELELFERQAGDMLRQLGYGLTREQDLSSV